MNISFLKGVHTDPSITTSTLSLPIDHLRSKEKSHNKQIANCSGSCAAIFYHQHIQFRNIGKQVLLDSKFNHKDCIGATFFSVQTCLTP